MFHVRMSTKVIVVAALTGLLNLSDCIEAVVAHDWRMAVKCFIIVLCVFIILTSQKLIRELSDN